MAKSDTKVPSVNLGAIQDRFTAARKQMAKTRDRVLVASQQHDEAKKEYNEAREALEAGTRVVLGG